MWPFYLATHEAISMIFLTYIIILVSLITLVKKGKVSPTVGALFFLGIMVGSYALALAEVM